MNIHKYREREIEKEMEKWREMERDGERERQTKEVKEVLSNYIVQQYL